MFILTVINMTKWKANTPNNITVITDKAVDLRAFYLEETNSGAYTMLAGVFTSVIDKHVLSASFPDVGVYILKIVDINSLILPLHQRVSVVEDFKDKNTESETHTWLDSYSNKEDWKGLTPSQENIIISNNNLSNSLDTKLSNVKSTVDTLPTLLDIEASTILAKKSEISVVEAIVNSIPKLSEIREEMINVQFGGLEIVNNQLIIKDKLGGIISILDLFDKNGNPTMLSVYKRSVSL